MQLHTCQAAHAINSVAGSRSRCAALQVGFAFRRIEMALNYIVDNLSTFSGLAAQSERLDALFLGELPPAASEPAMQLVWQPSTDAGSN